ncbi:MAG: hypothetical protein V3T40_00700 [Nitrososphaerales archaeon]
MSFKIQIADEVDVRFFVLLNHSDTERLLEEEPTSAPLQLSSYWDFRL